MKLTLIRGLPGSGKTTLAKTLPGLHVEADMYFIRDGVYQFNRESIGHAHAWCVGTAEEALRKGMDVVVSNTFVRHWEFDKYLELAETYGATTEIIIASGNYQTVHAVPPDVIERMRAQWEP